MPFPVTDIRAGILTTGSAFVVNMVNIEKTIEMYLTNIHFKNIIVLW